MSIPEGKFTMHTVEHKKHNLLNVMPEHCYYGRLSDMSLEHKPVNSLKVMQELLDKHNQEILDFDKRIVVFLTDFRKQLMKDIADLLIKQEQEPLYKPPKSTQQKAEDWAKTLSARAGNDKTVTGAPGKTPRLPKAPEPGSKASAKKKLTTIEKVDNYKKKKIHAEFGKTFSKERMAAKELTASVDDDDIDFISDTVDDTTDY